MQSAIILNTESMAAPEPMSRRRPLHTCAASMLAIIHTACRKTRELNGPIGTLTKMITRFTSAAFPLLNVMQYQCLAILSFTDDRILSLERIVETIFPPSTRLFDKIDKFVYTAEIMPEKLEKAFNKFPNVMHLVPFLDWVVMHLIWGLNFLISSLTHWGSKNTKEKDIMIDTNCKSCSIEIESAGKENCPGEGSASIPCPSPEEMHEGGKEESDIESPTFAESGNKEKIIPVLNSSEDGKETVDKPEFTAESSSSDSISAPMGDSLQNESKFSGHIELSSIAEHINKEELLPTVLASFQDESKLVSQVEFPGTDEHKNQEELLPLFDSSEDETNSVNNVECPARHQSEKHEIKSVGQLESASSAEYENKEELLPVLDSPEDETTTDKTSVCPADSSITAKSENVTSSAMGDLLEDETKPVCVKLEPDTVEIGHEKDIVEKGIKENTEMKDDNAKTMVSEEKSGIEEEKEIKKNEKEVSQQVLELFEARWHM